MAADTFPDIPPTIDSGGRETTFAILEATFGDGYVQAAADGINTIRQRWSLVWSPVTRTEGLQIIDFLNTQGGWRAFLWTPPREDDAELYRCVTFTDVPLGPEGFQITATFIRFYGPEPA